MHDAQISSYVIVGLVSVIIVSALAYYIHQTSESFLDLETTKSYPSLNYDMDNYVTLCLETQVSAFINNPSFYNAPEAFEPIIEQGTQECVTQFLDRLDLQGYDITQELPDAEVIITEDSIQVKLQYAIELEYQNKIYRFLDFSIIVPRVILVYIEDGFTTQQVRIDAPNGLAYLIIPAETYISDSHNNPVEFLSLGVMNTNFNGMTNGIIIGDFVIQSIPENVQFSQPVTLFIKYDGNDIPEGSTSANLDLAWWDNDYSIWRGLLTIKSGDWASAHIKTLKQFAVADCEHYEQYPEIKIFQERYSPCDSSYWNKILGIGETKIIANNEKSFYTDSVTQGYEYGYYSGNDFMDCLNMPDYTDDDGDFIIPLAAFDSPTKCENSANPECDSNSIPVYPGNVIDCGLCVRVSGTECECITIDAQERVNGPFGYPDYRCVGGKLVSDTYVTGISFLGNGNSCVRDAWVDLKPSVYDKCTLIPYPDNTIKKDILVESETSHLVIGIRGIIVENNNRDACASCSVIFNLIGKGSYQGV